MRKPISTAFLLLILTSAQAQAAPGWLDGIRELRQAAIDGASEVARFYFEGSVGRKTRSEWSSRTVGDAFRVMPDFEDAQKAFERTVLPRSETAVACLLHTHLRRMPEFLRSLPADDHSRNELSALEKLGAQGAPLAPPGGSDLSIDFDLSEGVAERAANARLRQSAAVVDSLGIWYYDLMDSSEERSAWLRSLGIGDAEFNKFLARKQELNSVRLPLMLEASRKKLKGQEILAHPYYRALVMGYAANDARIRFTPFENVGSEAPCQGVQPLN